VQEKMPSVMSLRHSMASSGLATRYFFNRLLPFATSIEHQIIILTARSQRTELP
jgi:hypothetical protein